MKGGNYPYTINDEYLKKLVFDKGEVEAGRIDNASYELILQNEEEEKSWFFDCLQRVIDNPRWYLDNLQYLSTFRVHITKIFPKKRKRL